MGKKASSAISETVTTCLETEQKHWWWGDWAMWNNNQECGWATWSDAQGEREEKRAAQGWAASSNPRKKTHQQVGHIAYSSTLEPHALHPCCSLLLGVTFSGAVYGMLEVKVRAPKKVKLLKKRSRKYISWFRAWSATCCKQVCMSTPNKYPSQWSLCVRKSFGYCSAS